MHTTKVLLAVIVLSVSAIVYSADKPKPEFVPVSSVTVDCCKLSEIQQLRLQVAQKDVLLAQQPYNQAMLRLYSLADQVRAENKWSTEVQFNAQDLSFNAPPPKPTQPQVPVIPPPSPAGPGSSNTEKKK